MRLDTSLGRGAVPRIPVVRVAAWWNIDWLDATLGAP